MLYLDTGDRKPPLAMDSTLSPPAFAAKLSARRILFTLLFNTFLSRILFSAICDSFNTYESRGTRLGIFEWFAGTCGSSPITELRLPL
jgi:hypothetical protein